MILSLAVVLKSDSDVSLGFVTEKCTNFFASDTCRHIAKTSLFTQLHVLHCQNTMIARGATCWQRYSRTSGGTTRWEKYIIYHTLYVKYDDKVFMESLTCGICSEEVLGFKHIGPEQLL